MTSVCYDKRKRKYHVILADPPWTYDNNPTKGKPGDYYQTMKIGDICRLPVGDLAETDSVLILLATWPLLREALQVMDAWGFSYIAGFPWVKVNSVRRNLWSEIEMKVQYGVGYWVRGCSEPILVGKRGKAKANNDFVGLLSPNVFHSRKPDDIYEYAESFPGRRVELFARRNRPGWVSWGDQVPNCEDVFNESEEN